LIVEIIAVFPPCENFFDIGYDRLVIRVSEFEYLGSARNWLLKLRTEKGLTQAVNLAEPFILSSQGKP